jgi:hypothetical protein
MVHWDTRRNAGKVQSTELLLKPHAQNFADEIVVSKNWAQEYCCRANAITHGRLLVEFRKAVVT